MAASQSLVNETEAVERAKEMKRQTERKQMKYICNRVETQIQKPQSPENQESNLDPHLIARRQKNSSQKKVGLVPPSINGWY